MGMDTHFRKARINKDRNFDGTFFFGVTTTGVFCRPSCPSPTAKEENVQYFESVFEALAKGFRPCLRCRPDVSLEYYRRTAHGLFLVNKALGLIYDGYLNFHSLQDLAQELGVSDRHLRKAFVENTGLSPVKFARFHKALFAKKLLTFSSQTITDVAFASGFGSLRQFNQVFQDVFGKTPTDIRNDCGNDNGPHGDMPLYLRYRKPFDFGHILSFLKPRAMDGVELVTENSYSRTFRTGPTRGYFTVTDNPEKSSLALRVHCDDVRCFMEIHNRVRKMFDMDTDFRTINEQFSKDAIFSQGMTNGHVPRLPIAFDAEEFVVRAILGQQITVKAATTLAARIAKKASMATDASFPEGLNYFFPTSEEILSLDLDGIGITNTRQATVQTVMESLRKKELDLSSGQTFDQFQQHFSSLKGIGDWTVNYVAMRGLGMADSFPVSDLGVIRALQKKGRALPRKEILALGEKWRPFRAYATLCLWNIPANGD